MLECVTAVSLYLCRRRVIAEECEEESKSQHRSQNTNAPRMSHYTHWAPIGEYGCSQKLFGKFHKRKDTFLDRLPIVLDDGRVNVGNWAYAIFDHGPEGVMSSLEEVGEGLERVGADRSGLPQRVARASSTLNNAPGPAGSISPASITTHARRPAPPQFLVDPSEVGGGEEIHSHALRLALVVHDVYLSLGFRHYPILSSREQQWSCLWNRDHSCAPWGVPQSGCRFLFCSNIFKNEERSSCLHLFFRYYVCIQRYRITACFLVMSTCN